MQEQNRDKNRLRSDLAKSGQDIDSSCNVKYNRAENQINGQNSIKNGLHICSLSTNVGHQVKDASTQLLQQSAELGSGASTCKSPLGTGKGGSPNRLPGNPSRTCKVNWR